jgi:hypothetical protein
MSRTRNLSFTSHSKNEAIEVNWLSQGYKRGGLRLMRWTVCVEVRIYFKFITQTYKCSTRMYACMSSWSARNFWKWIWWYMYIIRKRCQMAIAYKMADKPVHDGPLSTKGKPFCPTTSSFCTVISCFNLWSYQNTSGTYIATKRW